MKEIVEWMVNHSDYLFLLAAILLFGCTYVMAKRLIDWCFARGNRYLLSFIVGSLLFFNFFFFFLMIGSKEVQAIDFFPYLLQVIGIFGMLLLFIHGVKYVVRLLSSKKT